MPHASVSSGTAPRLETASTTTSAPDGLRGRGERLDVGDDAGRGLGVGEEDGLRAADLGEPRGEVVRRSASRPTRSASVLDLAAVAVGELAASARRSAPAETTTTRLAGRAEVRDRRLHRAGARAGEEEHVGRGAEDLPAAARGTRRRRARKSGPRWWTTGSASAASTSGGTGVGPGVKR